MHRLDHLLSLIDAWRAAKRAAVSEDYAAYRADYERRANDYALAIRTNGERMVER